MEATADLAVIPMAATAIDAATADGTLRITLAIVAVRDRLALFTTVTSTAPTRDIRETGLTSWHLESGSRVK